MKNTTIKIHQNTSDKNTSKNLYVKLVTIVDKKEILDTIHKTLQQIQHKSLINIIHQCDCVK